MRLVAARRSVLVDSVLRIRMHYFPTLPPPPPPVPLVCGNRTVVPVDLPRAKRPFLTPFFPLHLLLAELTLCALRQTSCMMCYHLHTSSHKQQPQECVQRRA